MPRPAKGVLALTEPAYREINTKRDDKIQEATKTNTEGKCDPAK